MTADLAGALAANLARLTAAGIGAVAIAVRRYAGTVRQMTRSVPALAPLADALDRAAASPAALLDALVIAGRLRAALATGGVPGELAPPPPSGPWRTPAPAAVVAEAVAALAHRAAKRGQLLARLVQSNQAGDLRLLGPMLEAVAGGDPFLTHQAATEAVSQFGPAVMPESYGLIDLKGKAADACRLTAIVRIDPVAGLNLCRQALAGGSPKVRAAALHALVNLAPDEARRAAISVLVESVAKAPIPIAAESFRRRRQRRPLASEARALTALAALKLLPRSPEAIPVLVEVVVRYEGQSRWVAFELLKEQAAAAVPNVIPLLEHDSTEVRSYAARTLAAAGPAAEAAVPALIQLLRDPCRYILEAVQALGRIGPPARTAVGYLSAMSKDAHDRSRLVITEALLRITGDKERYLPELLMFLDSSDHMDRGSACVALEKIGPPAVSAGPALIRMLKERSGLVVGFAATALASIGYDPAQVVPMLTAIVAEEGTNYFGGEPAIRALGMYGPAARSALPLLEALAARESDEDEPDVLRTAIAAIRGEPAGGPGDGH